MSMQNRTQLIQLLDRHGVTLRKSLGQHFLADPNITRRIVSLSEAGPGQRVVEVGAGTGTLTAALAETGASVVAYEVDERLAPLIEETLNELPPVEVRFADITRVDLATDLAGKDWLMVANLPYNVGTPLILDVLRKVPQVRKLVVMIQKEVADRLVAGPGEAAYGQPSVVAALHSRRKLAFRVPPQVFVPAPRVESAVVVLDRLSAHPLTEAAIRLSAAGFGQRRKMLRRSLAQVMVDPGAALDRAGIPGTARAEELSPEEFLRLAEVIDD